MSDKKRIFVADDDEAVFSSLKQLLFLAGFEVSGTAQAPDIINKIKEFKPQLILLDLLMPKLGGFEVIEIMNNDPEVKGIPIVVVSAIASYKDIRELCEKKKSQNVVTCIPKPFDFHKLLREINQILGA